MAIHTVQTGGQNTLVAGPAASNVMTLVAVYDTNLRIKLKGIRVIAMDAAGASLNMLAEVCHYTGATAGTPSGTAEVVTALNADMAAWTPTSAGVWFTAEPTVLTQVDLFPIHPTGWFAYDYPDGRQPEAIATGGFALRLRNCAGGTTADGVFGALIIEI
jgi:hypothetical protein